MKTILISGGGGYLGTELTKSLLQKYNVTIYTNDTTDNVNNSENYQITIDNAVPSGMYFYRMEANGFSSTRKMVFLK